jgi:hypothetical protein
MPHLVKTLQDAAEQPAALAVLGSLSHEGHMNQLPAVPELPLELTQVQQLHPAVLPDFAAPGGSTEVVRLLLAADDDLDSALTESELLSPLNSSKADMRGVHRATAVPVEHALLSVLGDLGAVWADAALQQLFLGLPLDVMAQLLASDQLKVGTRQCLMVCIGCLELLTVSSVVQSLLQQTLSNTVVLQCHAQHHERSKRGQTLWMRDLCHVWRETPMPRSCLWGSWLHSSFQCMPQQLISQ